MSCVLNSLFHALGQWKRAGDVRGLVEKKDPAGPGRRPSAFSSDRPARAWNRLILKFLSSLDPPRLA